MNALAGLCFVSLAIALPQTARTPLDVVLMIDVSNSTTHPGFFKFDRELVTDTVAGFASVLDPADRVRLGTFGAKVAITPAPVSGAAAVRQAAAGLADVGGSSPLWDALDTAANALEGATGRRAVIVVTDGRSTANRIGFAEILGRLERDRLPVVVLALDLRDLPGPDPTVRLRQLADKTGGKYFPVKRAGVSVVIKRAVESLRP